MRINPGFGKLKDIGGLWATLITHINTAHIQANLDHGALPSKTHIAVTQSVKLDFKICA